MNTASASVRARWFSPLTMVGVALIVIAGLASMALRFRRQQAESAESLHRSTELGLGPLVQTAPVLRGPPGRTIAVNGEVGHPGTYGIRPGEKLSSIIQRAGGFGPQAYPYGAVLMRREVRQVETEARMEMIRRL